MRTWPVPNQPPQRPHSAMSRQRLRLIATASVLLSLLILAGNRQPSRRSDPAASRRRDPSPTASDEENEVPVKKSKHQQQSVGGSTFTLHPIKPPFHWSSMTSFLFRANQGMGFKGEQHPGYQVADCLSTNETNTLALS